MSVIGKTPFVNRIIDNLNSNEVSSVISLLDHLGIPTHISLKKISDANKGISYVVFNLDEIQNKNVQGILVYSDASHCGLFGFNSTSGNMEEYQIDPVNKTYTQVYEHLTVEELRQVCGDAISGGSGGSKDYILNLVEEEEPSQEQLAEIYSSKPDRIIVADDDNKLTYYYKQEDNPNSTRLYYSNIATVDSLIFCAKIEYSLSDDEYIFELYTFALTPVE